VLKRRFKRSRINMLIKMRKKEKWDWKC